MDAPATFVTESSDSGTPDISVTTATNPEQNLTSQPTELSTVGDTAGGNSQPKSFALSSATEEQRFEEQDLAKDGVRTRTDSSESAEAGDVREPALTHESGDDMGTCSSSPKASAATSPALQKEQPTASSSPPAKEGASERVGDSSTGQEGAGQGPAAKDGEDAQAGSPGKSSISGPNSATSSPGGVSTGGAGGEDGVSVGSGTGMGSPAAGASPESHAAEHSGEDVLALVRQAHEGASRPGPYASSSIGVEPGAYGHHHGFGHGQVTGLDDSHEEAAMAGFDPYGYPVYGTSIPVYRGSKGSESGSAGGSPRGHHSRSYAGTPTSSPSKGSPPGMRGPAGKKAKALPSDDEIISQVLAEAVQESRLAAARAVLQANAMSQGNVPLPAAYLPAQHTALTQDAAKKVKSKSVMQGGGDARLYGRPGAYAGGHMAGAGVYAHEEEERAMHAQSLEIERDILGADFVPHGRRSSLAGMQPRSYQAPQHHSPLGSSGGHGQSHGYVYGRDTHRQESGRYGPGDAPEHDEILAAAAASVPEAPAVLRPLDAVLRKFSKGLHVLFMGFAQPAKSGGAGHDTFEEQKAAAHVVTKAAWLKALRFLGLLSTDSRGCPTLHHLIDTGSVGNSLPASAMAHTSPVMFSKEEAEGVWGDMIRAHRSTIPSLAHGEGGSPGGRAGGGGGGHGPGKKNSPALSAANALIGTAAILGRTQPAGPAHALDEARFIEGLARVAVYALTRHPVHAEIYPGDGDKVYAVFSKCGFGHPAEMARRIREEHTRPVAAAPVTSEGSAYEMRSLVETGMGTGPGRQPVQLQGGLVLEAQREARKAMRIAAVQQAKARQHAEAASHSGLATSSSSADTSGGGHGGWGTQQEALMGTQPSRLTPVGSARQMTTYSLNSAGTYQQSHGSGGAPASPRDPSSMAVSNFEASPSGGSSRGGAAYYGGGQGGGYPAGMPGGLQRAPYGVEVTPMTGPDEVARQAQGQGQGYSASPQGQGQYYYGGSPSQGAASPSGLPSSSMYDTGRSYFPANPPSYTQSQYAPGASGAPVPTPGPQYPQTTSQQPPYGAKMQGAFSPPRQAYPAGPGLGPAGGGQAQGWSSPVHMPRGPAMPPAGAAGGSPYVRYPTGGSKASGAGPGSPPRAMAMGAQGGMAQQGGRYPPNDSPTGGMTALVSAEEAALQREIDALTAIASDRAEAAGRAQAQRRGSVTGGRRASVGQGGGEVHMGSPQGRGAVRQGKAAGASVSPGPTGRQGYPSPQPQGLMQPHVGGADPRMPRGQAAAVQGLAASTIRSQQYQQQQMVPVGHMMQMAPGNRR